MAFRTFVDASGTEWLVYDVIPPADERRRTDRRGDEGSASPEQGDEGSDGESVPADRREPDDRRITVGRVSLVSRANPDGWLVFETTAERRRLSPIPDDWSCCDTDTLEAYRQAARPVPQALLSRGRGGVPERKR